VLLVLFAAACINISGREMCVLHGVGKYKKSTPMEVDYRDSLFSFRYLENAPLQKLILLLVRVIYFYLLKQHTLLLL
jgi:hypothetical protein